MTSSVKPRPLLTVLEVADRLGVSVRTVHRRIESGELPAVRLGSGPQRPVRVDPDELEKWLEASHVTPAERRVPEGGVVDGAAAEALAAHPLTRDEPPAVPRFELAHGPRAT